MQVYSPNLKGPLKVSGFIDPDDTTKISVYWSAPQFSAESVYRLGDVIRPSVDNGYYYQCTINGIAGTTEPIWNQEETISGTATFIAVPWNLWLLPEQIIDDSLWTVSNTSITLSQDSFNNYKSTVFVSTVPASLTEFELTNQIFKDNGESISRSFLYKVNQQ